MEQIIINLVVEADLTIVTISGRYTICSRMTVEHAAYITSRMGVIIFTSIK